MIVKACAKLNLFLNILGKLDDRYHEVEFINTQLELHDILEIEKSETISITPEISDNICLKALELLKKTASVRIKKNIPIASGLGGGSADAAAVLIAVNEFYALNLTKAQLTDLAKKISTDTCYCIHGGTCHVTGIGENIAPLQPIPQLDAIIVTPDINISNKTAWMYTQFDRTKIKPLNSKKMLAAVGNGDKEEIIAGMGNIFQRLELPQYAEVHDIIVQLKNKGCINAIMAGAGPSVVGIAKSQKEAKSISKDLKHKAIITRTI